jgi:hypothetical protein
MLPRQALDALVIGLWDRAHTVAWDVIHTIAVLGGL